jgi:hypothetical protein
MIISAGNRQDPPRNVPSGGQMVGKAFADASAVGPGRGGRLGGRAAGGQVGQGAHRPPDVVKRRLGVDPDGQARGRVSRQNLTGLDRRAGRHEVRDVGSAQGVEVHHPRGGLIGDAGGGQVAADQVGRPVGQGEQRAAGGQGRQPGGQAFDQGGGRGCA